MVKEYQTLIENYFKNYSLVQSNIESFDYFVIKGIQEILDEMNEIVPTIIPSGVEQFKINLKKMWVEKPQIIEADGSRRNVYPMEARLRNLTYSAPIFLSVGVDVDGIQRESFTTQIGKLPIMLRSKLCHLNGLKRGELIEKGEDPTDPGGYFILNGNERVLINVEDLATNKLFVEKASSGPSKYIARIFSERWALRIPHLIEQMRDGVIYLSFVRLKRIPIIILLKALGLVKDQDIINAISEEKQYDDIVVNLYGALEIKTQKDAIEYISKNLGIANTKEVKMERAEEILDRYLLSHIGIKREDRLAKAYNLCKLIKTFLMVTREGKVPEDKDHYMNKKLKLSGNLLGDLFRANLRTLINDILYNFQRLVKRGKYQSLKIIIRDKLLTDRIKSAMATGSWVGGRKGISQNIDRTNNLSSISHLQRVVSLLSATQENFEARSLHPTHWGRLCAVETPEGTVIGLRKNLALLSEVSKQDVSEDKIKKSLEDLGLKNKK